MQDRADADDARLFGAPAKREEPTQLMLMMFAFLVHLPSESPADANDVQEAAQLMLMMFACLGHLPSESPADADDAG